MGSNFQHPTKTDQTSLINSSRFLYLFTSFDHAQPKHKLFPFFQQTFTNRRGTYAILNYQGVDENALPIVRKRVCTPIVPCLAVNQIFGYIVSFLKLINAC